MCMKSDPRLLFPRRRTGILLFFMSVVETYEEHISHHKGGNKTSQTLEVSESTNCGCHPNEYSYYLEEHPRHLTHQHVLGSACHNTLPDIIGSFFPVHHTSDEHIKNIYFASMLSLLLPWRD